MTKDEKRAYIALEIYSLAYVALSVTWCILAQLDKPSAGVAQYIAYCHDALLMLTAHILTILNPPSSQLTAGPTPKQSGAVDGTINVGGAVAASNADGDPAQGAIGAGEPLPI